MQTWKKVSIVIICLAILMPAGYAVGYGLSKAINHDMHSDDHHKDTYSKGHSSKHDHMHEDYTLAESDPIPTINLQVNKDAKMGYNVRIKTTNFTFSPENVNQNNEVGTGHAHIYIDGEKYARVYSEWFHISKEGPFEVTATLNTNDHKEYHKPNGEAIMSSVSVS